MESGKKKFSKKAKKQKQRKSFRQRALAVLPVLLGSLFLTLLYSDTALFRKLGTTALDLNMSVRAPALSKNVTIVTITEDDYQKQFGGKSPLNPDELKKVLEAIAAAGPKAIGVDIDTSASEFQNFVLPAGLPPVIWAREVRYSNRDETYRMFKVLGQQNPNQPYGAVTLKRDKDGAIRRYQRWYRVNNEVIPSLPWQIIQVLRTGKSTQGNANESAEEMLIDYPAPSKTHPFIQVPVSAVLEWSKQGFPENNSLKGRVVLLGGDYAAGDEHDTPVGWMLGTEVLASIIETELSGGGKKPAGVLVILLLIIFDSVLLLLLLQLLGLWKTLVFSLGIIPVLAFVSSYLLFGSAAYIGYFLLVLTAILLHQLYEKGKEYLKKLKEQTAEQPQ